MRPRSSSLIALLFGLISALPAHAALALTDDCRLTSQCGLTRFLHILYAVAAVLLVALVIALIVALYSYLKNRNMELPKR